MSADLLRPPTHLNPPELLQVSQQAPEVLRKSASWSVPWPLSLIASSDSPEKWTTYENLFHACLRTGDDKSAYACLGKLENRFGDGNERVMGLVGMYHEAVASDVQALEIVLKSYEDAITENPTNMIIRKRHIALLQSLGRLDGAIAALVDLLDVVPVDAEAWSQLAGLYFVQSHYTQAIYSLEEVLLVTPNAWNMHARLGEFNYVSALAEGGSDTKRLKCLASSLNSFCRSVELCDNYLRGFYGLKMVTNKLLEFLPDLNKTVVNQSVNDGAPSPPPLKVIENLNELATSKLAKIVRNYSTSDADWTGYEESEVIAARELLDRDREGEVR